MNFSISGQKGFTLIEIIAVLVMLGILAAIAIPKYFDVQEQSRVKAAQGAISEVKGRANTQYGKYLLSFGGSPHDVGMLSVDISDFAGTTGDFSLTTGGGGTQTMAITISRVQGVPLANNATGSWSLPQ